MSNIENQICQAVEIIVDRALTQAQFDKTIKATIVNLVDSKTGKYKVRYQDDLIYAYAGTADMDFNTGDEVYILVPQGNFSGDKTILGTTRKVGAAAGDEFILSENEKYEIVGNNILPEQTTFRFLSYDAYKNGENPKRETFLYPKLIPYKEGAVTPTTLTIDDIGLMHYLPLSEYLVISANFATNFPKTQMNSGNYGIDIKLKFELENHQETIYTYRIDVNSIQGFPWGLGVDGITQSFYFKMPKATFKGLASISMFIDSFAAEVPAEQEVAEWDLWIKNLSIATANRIPDEDLNSYFLRLITKNGTYFNEINTADKTIEAFIYKEGRDVTKSENVEYYWFYQRADVTTQHSHYCSYGGEGWYCLNEQFENIVDKKWKPASNTRVVSKNEISTKDKIYKCVALYDNTVIEKQVVFFREDVDWTISLSTLTGETIFFNDEGETEISATLWNGNQLFSDLDRLSFKWMTVDYLNRATLNDSIKNVLSVKISDIVYSSTYLCTVFLDGEYLGTKSIVLTNNGVDLNSPRYSLIITNGLQVFKYDEDGISPANESHNNPITILPLQLAIFDNKLGKELNVSQTGSKVSIYVPKQDTLIEPMGQAGREDENYKIFTSYPTSGFAFSIADRYSFKKKNNTIKVTVLYNDTTLIGYTDFIFLKEGEDGTNGTSYVCKISPNFKEGEKQFGKEWISWTNNEDGSRSYNFDVTEGESPFFAKLLYNGAEVENVSNIIWSTLFRKYTHAIQEHSLVTEGPNPSYIAAAASDVCTSILKVQVTYDKQVYYATLPIVDIQRKDFNYNFEVKGGFQYVMYDADGTNPKYDNSDPFSIVVTDLEGNEILENLSYNWSILGKIYDSKNNVSDWYEANLLKQDYNSTTNKKNFLVRPATQYDGLCLSTGVQCIVSLGGTELATIFVPIHFYLNRFGHAAINGWDGNSIEINNEEGIILTPQVGAGFKDNNNAFTGMVMGEVKVGTNSKTGLVGYSAGEESIFLSAEDGSASFGKLGKGQIIIDPNQDKAIIKSGNYGNGSGLQIDLTTPEIRFGSGNFSVSPNGTLKAVNASLSGSFILSGYGSEKFLVKVNNSEINFDKSSGQAYLSYDDGTKSSKLDLTDGKFYSKAPTTDGRSSIETRIQPGEFYFGCPTYLDENNHEKGGYIRWHDNSLEISGGFNADWGSIGGWSIGSNELFTGSIRIYSGDTDKNIPPFLSANGDYSEIAVNGSDGKVAMRKGGLYLYGSSFELTSSNKGEMLNKWFGRLYANSKYNSLSIAVQSGSEHKPITFWGANIPDSSGVEKDHVLMHMQPGTELNDDYIQIGSSAETTSKLTRLFRDRIEVYDIKPYKALDTKANTIVDAINEIYPGGNLNIQHAVVVMPEDMHDILYDYKIVLHTHSTSIGYGPVGRDIYAQGIKMAGYDTRVYLSSNSDAAKKWITFPNYIYSKHPYVELYTTISATIHATSVRVGGTVQACTINSIYPKFDYTSNSKDSTTSWYYWKANTNKGTGFLQSYYQSYSNATVYMTTDYGAPNPENIKIWVGWGTIYSPRGNDYDTFGFGYVQCYFYVANSSIGFYSSDKSILFSAHESETLAGSFYIPFASEAEFNSAINLISSSQNLYEVSQNKTLT